MPPSSNLEGSMCPPHTTAIAHALAVEGLDVDNELGPCLAEKEIHAVCWALCGELEGDGLKKKRLDALPADCRLPP